MIIKFVLMIYFIFIESIYGKFKEITPLESQYEIIIENKNNNYINKDDNDNLNEKKNSEIQDEIEFVENNKEVEETIRNNSTPVITEKQLKEIIKLSKTSPLPSNNIEKKGEFYSFDFSSANSEENIDFFENIEKTLDKYKFEDKSDNKYGGRIISKELTSDSLVDNLEFGVGVTYENIEYDNEEQEKKQNYNIWDHTPVYATGRYNVFTSEKSTKYLKLNLGYAISDYENQNKYENIKTQNGIYYEVGGGVEYDTISLDLMYQVNKDVYEKENSTQDDSRITFSVDYKLDL